MMKKIKSRKMIYIFIVIFVVMLICASVVANYFCSSLYIGSAQNYSGQFTFLSNECYLLSVTKSQSELEAQTLAADYTQFGASGYIWKQDDYYHVIYSAHEKQNDASLLQNALKDKLINCEIIKITFPSFIFEDDFTATQHAVLQQASNSFLQTFRTLSDLAVGIETDVYTNAVVEEKLQKLQTSLQQICENYNDEFSKNAQNKIISLGEYLSDELESVMLSTINNVSLKYHAVEILDIYKNMCYEFNN